MKKIFLLIATTGLLASCAGWLDTEPQGPVSNEQLMKLVKENPDQVLEPMLSGAVNFMHSGARAGGTDKYGFKVWNIALDMMGNDVVLTNISNWFANDYLMQNYRGEDNARPADNWGNYYRLAYMSNQILDLIPTDASGKALVYRAQALTLRSMAFYYLVNIFQDDYNNGGKDKAGVPTPLTVGGALPRGTVEGVYTVVIDDLKEAIALFKAAGYNSTSSKIDLDQDVANFILAKALLTHGDYTDAAAAASEVIAKYSLMNEAQYKSGFQSLTLPETIWGYKWSQNSDLYNNSYASFMSAYASGYGGGTNNAYVAMDQKLYDQISATDYRKKVFLDAATTYTYADNSVGNLPKYTNIKFATTTLTQDEVFMRVSEMHVIKAEALARGGNTSGAQDALFALVSARDASYTKSTKTGTDLLNEVFLHGRIEMWGEGYEFFANKRFNKGVDRTGSANHITETLVLAAGKNFTFQIPNSSEMVPNPLMDGSDQNP